MMTTFLNDKSSFQRKDVLLIKAVFYFFLQIKTNTTMLVIVVANAFTIRNMHSLFLYMKCNSRKINRPTKNMTKIVTLLHF
jgi:hypothetical protein